MRSGGGGRLRGDEMTEMDVWSCCCSEVEEEDLQRGSPASRLSRGQSSERTANRESRHGGALGTGLVTKLLNRLPPALTLIATLLNFFPQQLKLLLFSFK